MCSASPGMSLSWDGLQEMLPSAVMWLWCGHGQLQAGVSCPSRNLTLGEHSRYSAHRRKRRGVRTKLRSSLASRKQGSGGLGDRDAKVLIEEAGTLRLSIGNTQKPARTELTVEPWGSLLFLCEALGPWKGEGGHGA